MDNPITPPPPHLLKKFSAQARDESNKRNGAGYLKTFAILCIEWAMNSQPTPNDRQIRSSDIAPPPELVQKWALEAEDDHQPTVAYSMVSLLAAKAAQWGADQKLEACCKWLEQLEPERDFLAMQLRAANPPALKQQALTALHAVATGANDTREQHQDLDTIRRALEALDD